MDLKRGKKQVRFSIPDVAEEDITKGKDLKQLLGISKSHTDRIEALQAKLNSAKKRVSLLKEENLAQKDNSPCRRKSAGVKEERPKVKRKFLPIKRRKEKKRDNDFVLPDSKEIKKKSVLRRPIVPWKTQDGDIRVETAQGGQE